MTKSVQKIQLERLARHPLQQARAVPVECPAHQGRRLDRGAGGGHRPSHAAAEPQRAAGARRPGRGDRHVRNSRGRPPLPRARAAGEAEAAGAQRRHPLRRARRTESPEEDCLAENVQRAPLHPLDQFRAFQTLRDKGQYRGGDRRRLLRQRQRRQAAAAARLRVARASRRLCRGRHDARPADGLHGHPDHERQNQVWEAIQRSYNKEACQIRRLLTEEAVRASDKRALYAAEEYKAAGGAIMRDLFQSDDGGWLQDVPLLERLVAEKLARDAEPIRAEGWKWVETAIDFPYGHTYGLRHLQGERQPLSEEEAAAREALPARSRATRDDLFGGRGNP